MCPDSSAALEPNLPTETAALWPQVCCWCSRQATPPFPAPETDARTDATAEACSGGTRPPSFLCIIFLKELFHFSWLPEVGDCGRPISSNDPSQLCLQPSLPYSRRMQFPVVRMLAWRQISPGVCGSRRDRPRRGPTCWTRSRRRGRAGRGPGAVASAGGRRRPAASSGAAAPACAPRWAPWPPPLPPPPPPSPSRLLQRGKDEEGGKKAISFLEASAQRSIVPERFGALSLGNLFPTTVN